MERQTGETWRLQMSGMKAGMSVVQWCNLINTIRIQSDKVTWTYTDKLRIQTTVYVD